MKITSDQVNNNQTLRTNNILIEKLRLNWFSTKRLGKPSIFLATIILFSLAGSGAVYADSVNFDAAINLSNNENKSIDAQVEISGNDVYVIWRDGNDILFITSNTGGATFPNPAIDIGNTGPSSLSGDPQLAFSGDNIYAVWRESGTIQFNKSSDNGLTFDGALLQLSSSTITARNPQIATSDSNVYSLWVDENPSPTNVEIILRKSTDNGLTFDSAVKIGESGKAFPAPQIASNGSSVYVVWQTESDILFSHSTDNGSIFSSPKSIGPSSGVSIASTPKLAFAGNDVYVVWQSSSNILIAHSSDGGDTFDESLDIGNADLDGEAAPQVSSSGNSVYVVWRDLVSDSGQIVFAKSSDNGSSFTTPSNPADGILSDPNGEAFNPKLAVSGSNIHIIWEDLSQSDDEEIFYRLSTDGGDTFSSFSNVSNNPEFSIVAQVTASGSTPFIVWQDDNPAEIKFRTGSTSPIDIVFDSTPYRTTDTASITITGTEASGSIIATVSSDTDLDGIPITLNEGPADTFTGFVTFTEEGSSQGNTLFALPSDNIVASFNGINGFSNIYPRSVGYEDDFLLFNLGSVAHLKVTDQNSNLDTNIAETIDVDIVSNTDTRGITLRITETGPDTGIFGGEGLSDLIFMIGNDRISITGSMLINQTSTIANESPDVVNSAFVDVTSTSNNVGITLELIETGNDTSLFQETLFLNTGAENSIEVLGGDILTVKHGSLDSFALVTPNPNPANGAIEVSFPLNDSDTITATYKNKSQEVQLTAFAGGGGGGGLVRPSLVVNALGGLAGGGSAYSAPVLQLSNLVKLGQLDVPLEIEQMIYNHDSSIPIPTMALGLFENFDYPLIINNYGFVLSGFSTTLETQTLQTNTPHTIKFLYYESDKIQHFSLYTNLRDSNTAIHQSDTQILYNDGQEIKVIDPNGFFEDVSLTINEIDDLKKQVVLEIIFAKEMATTDIIVRSWDPLLNSFDTYILDAIEVVSGIIEESPTPTYEEPVIEVIESQSIPKWIKNNAAWWSDQQISDSDFVSGIEYLIKNEIINVPGVEVGTGSTSTEIPEWIKNNAGWWAESLITDGDFTEAMQWLLVNGVIQI